MADTFVRHSVARIGDMHPRRTLRVRRMKDNDIIVSIEEDGMPLGGPLEPNATVEFCSLAGGGGRSGRVYVALVHLMKAIEEDNVACPSADPETIKNGRPA